MQLESKYVPDGEDGMDTTRTGVCLVGGVEGGIC